MKILKLNIRMFADTSVNVELEVRSNLTGINDTVSALEVLKDHVTNINNMPVNVSFNMNNILKQSEQLSTTLSTRLGNLNIPTPDLGIFDKVSDDIQKLNNDMARAPMVIGQSVETLEQKFAGLPVQINKVTDSTNKVDNSVKKVTNSVNNLGSVGKTATSSLSKGFKSILASLGVAASIAGVTKAVKSAVTAAANYEEARNLFVMAVGEYADENFEWAQKISKALYLDDSQIMQYAGSFFNLTKGLGAASDAANLMSKNLTQLSYDMASYLNIDVSAANTKLMSAMSGQTKAVTSVGIAVQQASLQELAYELGIKKSIASMTQAEKTYLRYIQIMRSTKQMQGDLGRTIITPTNAFRMLSTQVTLLGRALGQMLTPVIYKFMPMLIALTRVITQAAQKLAQFLGYKIQDIDYSGVDGLTDSMKNLGKEVDKTAAKANRMLAPFDQLNVVESKGGGGGGGAGNSVLDQLAKQLEGYDMLDQLNEKMADSISEWEERIKGFGKVVLGVAGAIAALKIIGWLSNLSAAMAGVTGTGVGAGLVSLMKNIAAEGNIASGALKSLGGTFTNILPAILPFIEVLAGIPLTIAGMVTATKSGIEAARGDISNFGTQILALGETVGGFALTLTGIFGFPAGTIAGVIAGLIGYSASFGTAFNEGLKQIAIDDLNTRMGSLTVSTETWLKVLESGDNGLGTIIKKLEEYDEKIKKSDETMNSSVENTKADMVLFRAGVGEYATISEEMLKTITNDVNSISATSTSAIKTTLDTNLLYLTQNRDMANGEAKKYWQDQIDAINKGATQAETNTKKHRDAIIEIYQRANKQHRNLNDAEWKQVNEHLNSMETEYNKYVSGVNENLDEHYNNILNREDKYNFDSIQNFIDAKNKYLNEVKEKADKEYAFAESQAKRLLDGTKEGQKKYDEYISMANGAREAKIQASRQNVNKYLEGIQKDVITTYTDLLNDTEHNTDKQQEILESMFKDLDIDPSDYFNSISTITNKGIQQLENSQPEFKQVGNGWGQNVLDGFNRTVEDGFKKTKWQIKADVSVSNDGKTVDLKTKDVKSVKLKAGGGFLDTGDMFIANEAGPEFITSIGNKSAVVNQSQMVNALASALADVASSITSGNRPAQPITINLGNDTLWKGKVNYDKQQLDRYGSSSVINV